MAALGISALISGVLHTTGATNKLQKVEQEKVAILRSMGDQAGVSITAQAVKTEQGYFVVDSLTPGSEADALLDAIQLKSEKKLNPTLLQVPGGR